MKNHSNLTKLNGVVRIAVMSGLLGIINSTSSDQIQTNNSNIYNSGLNTLQTLEKGTGEPLSDFDNARIIQSILQRPFVDLELVCLELECVGWRALCHERYSPGGFATR